MHTQWFCCSFPQLVSTFLVLGISFQSVHFRIFCGVGRSFSSYSVNWNAELGVFCRSQMQKSDANASPDLFFFCLHCGGNFILCDDASSILTQFRITGCYDSSGGSGGWCMIWLFIFQIFSLIIVCFWCCHIKFVYTSIKRFFLLNGRP